MRKLLTILLLSISSIALAQEMSVKSFYLAENDLTANTPGTMVYDQNGNVCALIKVESTLDGFSFDVGTLGVSEVKRVGGEIWVYVPYGIRRITLSHPQLGVIRDYQIPCPIERGRTYILTLVSGTVRTIIEQVSSKQFLYIELSPKEAILEINGKIKATENGVYQELLQFGKYQYKAYSQNYHDVAGIVDISDPNNTQTLKLSLKPAFGNVSVSAAAQEESVGAAVYIDEKYIGQIPINDVNVNSGSHRLRVIKDMYEAYNDTFVISDGEHITLSPSLIPDFAELTIRTVDGASIYINGELKALNQWSGKLSTGSYIFESRQKGHIPYKKAYEISRKDEKANIDLPGPTPIYGSLVISSNPSKAQIYIDGKYIGDTPKYISNHVIGEYAVTVQQDGYKSQTKTVQIVEGSEVTTEFILEQGRETEQDENNYESEEPIPFQIVEEKPTFQGGDTNEFTQWVNKRLIYPELAKSKGVQGRVMVQFIVDKNGDVRNVKVIKSVDPSLDKEAVRVVAMSPKWKAGKMKGQAVDVMYVFPVIFNLTYGSWR